MFNQIIMKKLLFSIATIAIITGFGSCSKCYQCTYPDGGTATTEADTSNFCGSGKVVDDQKKQHEKSGWTCAVDKN